MPCAGLQLLTNMALFLGAELFKAQAAGHVLQSLNQWLLLVSRRDTVDRSIGLGGGKASEQEELQHVRHLAQRLAECPWRR